MKKSFLASGGTVPHDGTVQELGQLGWGNIRIDTRWAAGDADRFHRYAEELLALAPDVILASATPSVQALQQATRTVPIVFANVGDPVGMGFVESLARPGGNIAGFTPFEFGFGAKWLELLKEIAPRLTRVDVASGPYDSCSITHRNAVRVPHTTIINTGTRC